MTTMPIVQKIRSLSKRLESAQVLASQGLVTPVRRPDQYAVSSSPEWSHRVRAGRQDNPPGCTCQDFHYRSWQLDSWCKHRLAVELYLAAHPAPQSPQALNPVERLERDLAELF